MGYPIKQSSTAQELLFLMVLTSDHLSPATGLSPTVTIRKSGGSFASPAGAVAEVANGWYKVAGNATDSGTLGPLLLHATGTGADPVDEQYHVVAYDPQVATNLGLSALPTASPAAVGGLLTAPTTANTGLADVTRWLGTAAATPTVAGVPEVDITHINGVAATTTTGFSLDFTQALPGSPTAGTVGEALKFADTRLDAAVTSRASQTSVDTIDDFLDTEIAAILAKTNNLPAAFPANFADLAITVTTGRVTAGSVSDKTGYTLTVTPPTEAAIADAVWDEVQSGHTTAGTFGKFLDVAVSSVGGGGGATVDAIWDALRLDHLDAGTMGEALGVLMSMIEADGLEYRYVTNALEQAPAGGSGLDAAGVRAAIGMASANLDTQLGAIVADTNELQTDWVNGGRLDLLIDAIKAKSDGLPSDPADASDIAASFATVNSTLGTIAGYIDTEMASTLSAANAVKAVTDKLATMLEVDGSNFRYTTDSLFNAPAGGGGGSGDWTTTEKGQIRYRLGLDGTQVEPTFELDPYVQVDLRQYLGVDCPATPINGAPLVALSDGTGAGQISLDAGSVVQVNNVGTTATLTDRTGFALAADGLDAIPITAPDGVAETFREMLVQTWRRFFGKTTMSATQIKTFADDSTTVLTTQSASDDGVVQTQGPAT